MMGAAKQKILDGMQTAARAKERNWADGSCGMRLHVANPKLRERLKRDLEPFFTFRADGEEPSLPDEAESGSEWPAGNCGRLPARRISCLIVSFKKPGLR